MAGVAVGLLTTAVLVLVGGGAYRAGQRSDATIQVVGSAEGSELGRTLVVATDGWRDGWHGPGPGILIFPLIVIGLVLLFASRRGPGRGPGGWHRGWGDGGLDDWHRQAHAAVPVGSAPAPATDAPPPTPGEPTGGSHRVSGSTMREAAGGYHPVPAGRWRVAAR